MRLLRGVYPERDSSVASLPQNDRRQRVQNDRRQGVQNDRGGGLSSQLFWCHCEPKARQSQESKTQKSKCKMTERK